MGTKETKQMRVNEEINAPEVRLISNTGEQLGINSRDAALLAAADAGLDLCEISPNAKPPVCRIMDFGKFKYEQARKEHEARKKQKVVQMKEVKMGIKINPHDYGTKLSHIRRFLSAGNKVRVTLLFHGREIAHVDFGKRVLDRLIEDTKTFAVLERPPILEGKAMACVLAPAGAA